MIDETSSHTVCSTTLLFSRAAVQAYREEVSHFSKLMNHMAARGPAGGLSRRGSVASAGAAAAASLSRRASRASIGLRSGHVSPYAGTEGGHSRDSEDDGSVYGSMTSRSIGTSFSRRMSVRSGAYSRRGSVASVTALDGPIDRDMPSRVATASAFSADGSLLAVGCNDRLVAIMEAARPHRGAMALVR